MYQRIMEILVLIMDEFGSEKWHVEEMVQVSENLIERGYTEQEINTAFTWLHHRFQFDASLPADNVAIGEPEGTSHRVLHTLEQRYLNPEAHGYLLQLKHLSLIDSRELEEVIERLFILDFQPATVEDVAMIVQSMLFEEGGFGAGNLHLLAVTKKEETYH